MWHCVASWKPGLFGTRILGIPYRPYEDDEDRIVCAYPLIGFGFWGAVDFHQFGRLSEWLRLMQELVISGMAAFALYITGQHYYAGYSLLCQSFIILSVTCREKGC